MRPAARLPLLALIVLGLTLPGGVTAGTTRGATPIALQTAIATLFTTTVPATIPPRSERSLLLAYAIVGPGVSVTSPTELGPCCPGIQFSHVLTGTFALRSDGMFQVVRGARAGTRAPPEAIAPGTQVRLHAGETAVFALDRPLQFANPGTEAVQLIEGSIGSRLPTPHTPRDIFATAAGAATAPPLPSGPTVVTLQQATLSPEGILAAPLVGDFRTVLAGLALARLAAGRDGAVQNRGRTPVVVYALTRHPVDAAAESQPRSAIVRWGDS